MKAAGSIFLMGVASLLAGCGSGPNGLTCGSLPMLIQPASVTLDHTAAPPGNMQQFDEAPQSEPGCATPQFLVAGPLVSSDKIDVSVTENGVVTCLNTTPEPVTLSSSLTTNTATLVCK